MNNHKEEQIRWEELKKLKLCSFKDETGRICWSFYSEDLKKLFKIKNLVKRKNVN